MLTGFEVYLKDISRIISAEDLCSSDILELLICYHISINILNELLFYMISFHFNFS